MKTYFAIQFILKLIENNLSEKLSIEYLARQSDISPIHLQRVFMMMFKMPLATYIRLRKLSVSLKRLAFTDYKIIDIANELGFEHEQSFIRAFRREFGITPGQYKNKGVPIKITPPFTMDDFTDTACGILSKPDIVVIPEMNLIGEKHDIARKESLEKPPRVARAFWESNRFKIKNAINKNIFIGLTRWPGNMQNIFFPSIQTTNINTIPEGLTADRLPSSEYFCFYYIGKHHPYDLNINVLSELYHFIFNYLESVMNLDDLKIAIEKIDMSKCDDTYCYMEWLTPVSPKL